MQNNSLRPNPSKLQLSVSFILELIRKFCGGNRSINLYHQIKEQLRLTKSNLSADINLLDYGCGNMMFSNNLFMEGEIKSFTAVDIYDLDVDSKDLLTGRKYTKIITHTDIVEDYDVCLLIDVLHHLDGNVSDLLSHLSKKCKFLIIKDHIEYGFFTRLLLRISDFYGNWIFGVKIPDKYFTMDEWVNLVKKLNLNQENFRVNIQVHTGLFAILLPSKCHFITTIYKI